MTVTERVHRDLKLKSQEKGAEGTWVSWAPSASMSSCGKKGKACCSVSQGGEGGTTRKRKKKGPKRGEVTLSLRGGEIRKKARSSDRLSWAGGRLSSKKGGGGSKFCRPL